MSYTPELHVQRLDWCSYYLFWTILCLIKFFLSLLNVVSFMSMQARLSNQERWELIELLKLIGIYFDHQKMPDISIWRKRRLVYSYSFYTLGVHSMIKLGFSFAQVENEKSVSKGGQEKYSQDFEASFEGFLIH